MEWIYRIPEWLVMLTMVPLLLAAGEIGFRSAFPYRDRHDSQSRATFATIQAGVLGLLALLLGFLFSMSVARFELRRNMIVDEANALGTVALRCDFLERATAKSFREDLANYGKIRVDIGGTTQSESGERIDLVKLAGLQDSLWQAGVTALRDQPTSRGASLLVEALNELFDAQGKTRAAYLNHIPETAILMVLMVAVAAMGMVGHGNGLVGVRLWRSQFLFSFLITLVLLLIMDLDRPNRGMIQVSQAPMAEAIEAIKSSHR